MGGAKAIIATVTNAEAMQAIAGGLGPNGVHDGDRRGRRADRQFAGLLQQTRRGKRLVFRHSANSEDTLQFSQLNEITSMNEIFPLEKAQAAYDQMMSGKARFRVVLKMD